MTEVKTEQSHSTYLDLLIQSLAASSPLAMDFDFGIQLFNSALQDIALLNLGIPYQELGISKRREACKAQLLVPTSATADGEFDFRTVSDIGIYKESETPEGSIALLKLRGLMQNDGGISSKGVYDFADDLRQAYRNRNIAAVIVDVDSGGGQSTAGNLARNTINERNKPVLANVNTAASAAYSAISGADEIIAASKDSRIGGIGTFVTLDMKMLSEYRARFMDIYAEASGNKNREFRSALEGDFSALKTMVTTMTGEFQESIKAARPLTGDRLTVKETLSGAMFGAQDAKSRGLIDGIGNFNYLMSRTKAWTKRKKK